MNQQGKSEWILAFDIVSNRKRRKLCKLLEDYGIRIQKSVFYFRAEKERHLELLSKMKALISIENKIAAGKGISTDADSIQIIRVGKVKDIFAVEGKEIRSETFIVV